MKRKTISILLALSLALSLAACGGGSSAPPPEPECEHIWSEANYQEPMICAECGETEGGPLTPAFASLGNTIRPHGSAHTYKTVTFQDPSIDNVGEVTVTDYYIIEGDDTHEAKEGYEWRIAHVSVVFDDGDVNWDGVRIRTCLYDYYTGFFEETIDDFTEANETRLPTTIHTVSYYGEDYEIESKSELQRNEWVMTTHYTFYWDIVVSYHVPVGYDGIMFGFYNAGNFGGEESKPPLELVDSDAVFFRLA